MADYRCKAGYAETVITETVATQRYRQYDVIKSSPIIMAKNLNLFGQITNDTAQGIAGAVVTVSDISNTYSDTTDSSGNYFISLPDGSYEIAVIKRVCSSRRILCDGCGRGIKNKKLYTITSGKYDNRRCQETALRFPEYWYALCLLPALL